MLNNGYKQYGIQYTPESLSDLLAMKLKFYSDKYFQKNKKITILDPACGDGNLLKAIDKYFDNYNSIGIDLDEEAINNAKNNLKITNAKLINMDYLDLFEETNLFSNKDTQILKGGVDLIIANPPYIRNTVMGANKSQNLSNRFKISGNLNMYQVF